MVEIEGSLIEEGVVDETTLEFLVCFGASAGGIESLEGVIPTLSRHANCAYVVIQHLSPDFKSHLPEILRRWTDIPVVPAIHGMDVRGGKIYIAPAGKRMIVHQRKFLISEKDSEGISLPIDEFFRSMAREMGRGSVAVVVSGTGSDGTRGAEEVAASQGLVIAQNPETASFDGMPRSLIGSGVCNLVIKRAAIGPAIDQFITTPFATDQKGVEMPADDAGSMEPILETLSEKYSVDFSQYKKTTIQRRVHRRMGFRQIPGYSEYVNVLKSDPTELRQLFDDLLIGVTAFFRDASVFELLRKRYLKELVERLAPDHEFRAWTVGCASGEEAYSLAMTIHEIYQELGRPVSAKIFATDLHARAIQTASNGLYEPTAISGVNQSRLNRYFELTPQGYRVKSFLREMLIFAPHNAVTDAPFLRLDFISCRNLLIYLQPDAQKRVLSLFHFSLRKDGLLLLGSSETLGELADEFDTVDSQWKLYSRAAASTSGSNYRSPSRLRNLTTLPRSGKPSPPVQTEGPLLDQFMPTGILIDGNRDVIHCYGGAEAFLRVPSGQVSRQISGLIKESLRPTISVALQRVDNPDQSARVAGGRIMIGGKRRDVMVTAEPVRHERAPGWTFLRIETKVNRSEQNETTQSAEASLPNDHIRMLEDDLQLTRENLQATIEQLEAANEELQATNEELTASNEELQSTNEELHSVNEELFTVNTDHQRKIAELIEVTDDLNNLLTSTEVGVIFLDSDLRIRKFTESVKHIFDLVDSDVGRKITSFSDRFGSSDFREMLAEVQAGNELSEREIATSADEVYLLRILPYSTIAGKLPGDLQLVVTIVDVSSIKKAEAKQIRLARLIDQSSDFIVSTDGSGIIETWNHGAEEMLGGDRHEVVGQSLAKVLANLVEEKPFEGFFEKQLEDQRFSVTTWTVLKDQTKQTLKVDLRAALQRNFDGPVTAVSFIARDVSAITEANRRVEASENELRRVMETVTEAIMVLDSDARFKFVNDGLCQMMNVRAEDLIGNCIWDVFPDTEETPFKRMVLRAMESGETNRFEEFFSSTQRWYQCYCFPSADRLTLFFTDVTDVRLSSDLMQQQAEMLELSHDAILTWDFERGIRFWNRGAELLYGFSRGEVIGKPSHEVLRTEQPNPGGEIAQIIRECGEWEGRLLHYTRDGRRLEIASRMQLIKSSIDDTEIVLEINRDMTEQKRLSNRVSQLASIADLTTDFVATAEAGGELVYLNRGASRLLGFDAPEQLRGRNLLDLHSQYAKETLRLEALPSAARGEVFQFESELVTRSGEHVPISQVVMGHLDTSGQVTHYSTIARDISARKVYELELESMRDAAEAANRAKSAFLAQMSHEIRTPMTAILGCSEQLRESVESDENRLLSRVMVEQGHALMAILDDILDLSRIEAEKIELEFRQISVAKVLRDLHRLMTPRAEETGLEFKLQLNGKFPKEWTTDPVRLRQIIVNLLSNAFKFTPEGSVTLGATCFHKTDGSELQIEVADSGVGIAAADLQGIFEAFARLHNPAANAAGTGLGLTIAHRLTERLCGELDVESTEGLGTTFFVRFPIPGPDQTDYATAEESVFDSKRLIQSSGSREASRRLDFHILVAEDTDAIRFLLSKILGPVVTKLTMVEDGAQAVEKVNSDDSISLVLMDMQMPVMSGVEATRAIRSAGHRLPIIALTAGAMDADRNHCIDAGCTEFLTKPINKRRLLDLIEEQFESCE